MLITVVMMRMIKMVTTPEPLLVYGQITYGEQFDGTKRCVEEMSPYVDYVVIVCEKQRPFTEEQKRELLKHPNVMLIEEPFNDSIPEFRNMYLDKAKELRRKHNRSTWLIVSDHDEYFCEELRRDLRNIIREHDIKGYNQLGVNCAGGFKVHEWMDDIDILKEIPKGLREGTSYFKLLIFKICCDQLHYEGIGVSKTVHETWHCPVHYWKPIYLPRKYYYLHEKSSLYIWRNSARNVYLGGGGNNLGDKVPEWLELKSICNALGISNWREYENYLKRGKVDPMLKKFLIKCLDMPRTDFGVEYRQMTMWYFAMHKDELTPDILYKIKHPPKLTPELEVEYYVIKCYREVLGREPDDEGRRYYTEAILTGKVKREELVPILMLSDEYKIKHGIDEVVAWVIKCYFDVLKRAPDEGGLRNYVNLIRKGEVKPEELPGILRESEEYKQRFGG